MDFKKLKVILYCNIGFKITDLFLPNWKVLLGKKTDAFAAHSKPEICLRNMEFIPRALLQYHFFNGLSYARYSLSILMWSFYLKPFNFKQQQLRKVKRKKNI